MNIKSDNYQKGMASIMFAMFIAIVISLLAIGFAVLVRNDQRQTLDNKLSSQAQYAAETAINQKQRQLQELVASGTPLTDFTECGGPGTGLIDSRMPDVKVTCLTWDPNPKVLAFNNVSITNPWVTTIKGNSAIKSFRIVWSKVGTGASVAIGSNSQLNMSSFPTLRLTVASKDDIMGAKTVYLVPHDGTGDNASLDTYGSGSIARATCSNATLRCEAVVGGLPGAPWNPGIGGGWGLISLTSLNGTSNIESFTAWSNGSGGGNDSEIVDAQVKIDATARAQDVIKRLQAMVPIDSVTWHPGFAAMANKLCKNYKVDGTNNNIAGPVNTTDVCPVDPAP